MDLVNYDLVVVVDRDGEEFAHRLRCKGDSVPRIGEMVDVCFTAETQFDDSVFTVPANTYVCGTVSVVEHYVYAGSIEPHEPHVAGFPSVLIKVDYGDLRFE